jgi:hypothetical protein
LPTTAQKTNSASASGRGCANGAALALRCGGYISFFFIIFYPHRTAAFLYTKTAHA